MDDCGDRTDDSPFLCNTTCNQDEFMWDFGYYIKGEYVCNTNTDCLDENDEQSSDYWAKILTDEQFQCHTHEAGVPFRRACFPLDAVCDGVEDCTDGLDEWN